MTTGMFYRVDTSNSPAKIQVDTRIHYQFRT